MNDRHPHPLDVLNVILDALDALDRRINTDTGFRPWADYTDDADLYSDTYYRAAIDTARLDITGRIETDQPL